jgi:hypothetical protein
MNFIKSIRFIEESYSEGYLNVSVGRSSPIAVICATVVTDINIALPQLVI